MAVTYKQLVNRVLSTIGETQLGASDTELTTKYQKLVGSLVNIFKEEVEDSWNWRALRNVYSVAITGGASSATITGATERSRLYRLQQAEGCGAVPLVFDITAASNPVQLTEMDLPELLYRLTIDDTQVAAEPSYFALDNTSGDVQVLRVYPIPASNRTISVTLITPQAYLADSDLSTNIVIPSRPIQLGATWAALEERGEELGPDSLFSEQRYRDALAAAIGRDLEESGGIDLVLV